MSPLKFILGEAWNEFVAGITSGIALLILVALTAYIFLMLTSAGYIADMSGADVPRNAASLVYMFATGESFFLFFAWAWLFAQPILRDRSANLHEIVFTAPVSLRALLTARYLGALGVAVVVGASPMLGFIFAPILESLGAVPPGSLGPTPWAAMAWGWLIFTVPTAAICGAFYFVAAMRTHGAAGPFAVSALLMLMWMIAIVVLKDAVDPMVQTMLDVTCFTDVERLVRELAPVEKADLFYPLTANFMMSRLLWGVLSLGLLAFAIARACRESLALERENKRDATARVVKAVATSLPPPIARTHWGWVIVSEIRWQLARLLASRAFLGTVISVILMGLGAGFFHVTSDPEGPYVARPENTPDFIADPIFAYLLIIVAAMAGFIMRRDDRQGYNEMIDAAPAPDYVRLAGRCATVLLLALVFGLVPAVSTGLVMLIAAPDHANLISPLFHQLFQVVPALLELATLAVLAHAIFRRSGAAYAASMFGAWAALVAQETSIVEYPPLHFAKMAELELSGLLGWGVWAERLALIDGLKLFTVMALMAVAGIVMVRGTDSRLAGGARQIRVRVFGPIGAVLLLGAVGAALLYKQLGVRFDQGGFQTTVERKQADAAWERRWLAEAQAFSVAGGELALIADPQQQRVDGTWSLRGVRSEDATLDLELPHGLKLTRVTVAGKPVQPTVALDHAAIPLASCAVSGCDLEMHWIVDARGWIDEALATIMAKPKREPAWLSPHGAWLFSDRVMPRLGFDLSRVLRAPADRRAAGLAAEPILPMSAANVAVDASAPAAAWSWSVRVIGGIERSQVTNGPLSFAIPWAPSEVITHRNAVAFISDVSRTDMIDALAFDVQRMGACIDRRLGGRGPLATVAQLPRGLGESQTYGDTIMLAEQPHWDLSGAGRGRWRRQAVIAELMARRRILDDADVRQGPGANWLSAGLAGAIGLACAAEENGLDAFRVLLERSALLATNELSYSKVPIRTVSDTVDQPWAGEYAPLATVGWVLQTSPAQIEQLLRKIRISGDVTVALADVSGADMARQLLGPPQHSELSAQSQPDSLTVLRELWADGGWAKSAEPGPILELQQQDGPLTVRLVAPGDPPASGSHILYLDARGYERSLVDNQARTNH